MYPTSIQGFDAISRVKMCLKALRHGVPEPLGSSWRYRDCPIFKGLKILLHSISRNGQSKPFDTCGVDLRGDHPDNLTLQVQQRPTAVPTVDR